MSPSLQGHIKNESKYVVPSDSQSSRHVKKQKWRYAKLCEKSPLMRVFNGCWSFCMSPQMAFSYLRLFSLSPFTSHLHNIRKDLPQESYSEDVEKENLFRFVEWELRVDWGKGFDFYSYSCKFMLHDNILMFVCASIVIKKLYDLIWNEPSSQRRSSPTFSKLSQQSNDKYEYKISSSPALMLSTQRSFCLSYSCAECKQARWIESHKRWNERYLCTHNKYSDAKSTHTECDMKAVVKICRSAKAKESLPNDTFQALSNLLFICNTITRQTVSYFYIKGLEGNKKTFLAVNEILNPLLPSPACSPLQRLFLVLQHLEEWMEKKSITSWKAHNSILPHCCWTYF